MVKFRAKFWLPLTCLLVSATAAAANSPVTNGQKANRLLNEPSPYLRQHAHNPVDWYPWGKEAFAKAKAENKPIFLSVGYSTCHWCHVMERESFSDQKIADLINENFVAIKVDRERRPDIDETYILATQIATGSSGWPNNVFLTPDLKPFVGGTYFPPEDFTRLLTEVALRWLTDQDLLKQEGRRIAGLIDRILSHRVAAADVTPQALTGAAATSLATFDPVYGGIGTANKFPRENLLLFLLDRAEKYNDKDSLKAATRTLDAMIHGGIQDQIGGGFHRYTVDRKWQIPHFEKMLYNQAQAGRALVQAYRITGERRYKYTARALFDFVLRDMTSPRGGFYSAFDADSLSASGQLEEGLFYLWDQNKIEAALSADDAAFAKRVFGITFEGNFDGHTILYLPKPLRKVAIAENMTMKALTLKLDAIKTRLRNVRSKRKAPYLDEKMLTSWNGLMIKALSEAAVTFGEPRYRQAALKAAKLFWRNVRGKDGKLKRYYYKGAASLDATQPDYALLALGFVALYDVTQNKDWLNRAKKLADAMNAKFLDENAGDYYMTAAGSGFYRPKISTDGDIPSGNASALELFAKLSRRQLDLDYRSKGEALLSAISGVALQQPEGYSYALRSADELLRGETGSLKFIAKGRVRAMARLAKDSKSIVISATIANGWHINAHKPLEDLFIPTDVKLAGNNPGDGVQQVSYPAPVLRKLGFNDKELAVYEGKVAIVAHVAASGELPKTIAFTAQTCSDKICLEPETITLSVLQ